MVNEFARVCERRKLRVNIGKSKVMRCSRYRNADRMHVILNGELLEEVHCFKYQMGVDGRSQWRMGTRETEVRLDGWCEGGLKQQRNIGGGCATMRERSERVESPGTFVTE